MSKFKVGEEVISNETGGTSYPAGTTFMVTSIDPFEVEPLSCFPVSNHSDYCWCEWWFDKVKTKTNKSDIKIGDEDMKSWTFNIISEKQIDFEEIARDLSHSNPIATVDHSSGEGWVVVHKTLARKAYFLGMNTYRKVTYLAGEDAVIFCPNKQAQKQWIRHLKNVRKAEWPEEERNKGTVTVTMIGGNR
jgi:hypothetical protein